MQLCFVCCLFFYLLGLVENSCFSGFTNVPSICPPSLNRTEWGARKPLEVDYVVTPVQYVIVHHTVTSGCRTQNECASILTSIQNFHMDEMDFHDIGYNFIVGGDGQVYEGAGFHRVGAHTRGYNTKSMGLAFIGNFNDELPNSKQLQAAKDFLQCAMELKELAQDYQLFAGRQVSSTQSPGLKLFRNLRNWQHFSTPKAQLI